MKKVMVALLVLLVSCSATPRYSYSIAEGEVVIYSDTAFLYDGQWVTFAKGTAPIAIYSTNGQEVWVHTVEDGLRSYHIGKGSTTFP